MLKSLAVNLYKCFFCHLHVGTLWVLATCAHLISLHFLDMSEYMSIILGRRDSARLLLRSIRTEFFCSVIVHGRWPWSDRPLSSSTRQRDSAWSLLRFPWTDAFNLVKFYLGAVLKWQATWPLYWQGDCVWLLQISMDRGFHVGIGELRWGQSSSSS